MKTFAALLLAATSLSAEEVTLQTMKGALYGTLLMPANVTAKVPAAVIISGSGPTDRDGNSAMLHGKNDSLKMLAEALARRGIASLRYDKRGIAASRASAASEADLRFETYIEDAIAWGNKLRGDERFSSVAYVGHSEGSLIAIIAAQRLPAGRLVSISGTARPAGDLILSQLKTRLSPDQFVVASKIIGTLTFGRTVTDVPMEFASLFRPSVQPYLISWFRYDPSAEIRRLKIPILVVQGTTDIQVMPDEARRLAAANPNASLVMVEGMNHVLKDVTSDDAAQLKSYADPALAIDAKLVDAIAGFLGAQNR